MADVLGEPLGPAGPQGELQRGEYVGVLVLREMHLSGATLLSSAAQADLEGTAASRLLDLESESLSARRTPRSLCADGEQLGCESGEQRSERPWRRPGLNQIRYPWEPFGDPEGQALDMRGRLNPLVWVLGSPVSRHQSREIFDFEVKSK